ncbi:hypothetical protein B2904_orf2120 [Brachyspira pilosicoli B2904]|uniref:Uncharacterized protein n=1 Tax=Brachyspira pilosicoli B2904 TaxID=1133568 RepID=J9UW40_BRAPL|nr:hypothetical protein [Brachyspira pilosicoli]AFR71449.1 hypothetical protein B2904_orf2120 [Brachyspira pilosicoli B2904]
MRIIIISVLLFLQMFFAVYADTTVDFKLFTSSYAYNGENTYWQDTRTTLTYFENFTEGAFDIKFNDLISLSVGASVFFPFTFEFPQGIRVFPIVTTQLSNEYIALRIGTMKGGHNLPAPIRDPLMDMTPVVRSTPDNTLIAKGPEEYKYNEPFTHGYYEYGASFEWFKGGRGEVYMNWQIQHNAKHRERFDVGLTYALDFLHNIATPYLGVHYWHNGGHEYPFVEGSPAITENYVGAIGINSEYLSILYMASYNLVDRDNIAGQFGHAIFLRGSIDVMTWFKIEPIVFVSGWYINKNHKFISVEGDPFYRVPFYFGLNLTKDFIFDNGIVLSLGFVNGLFLTEENKVGIRYDQTLKFDFTERAGKAKNKFIYICI